MKLYKEKKKKIPKILATGWKNKIGSGAALETQYFKADNPFNYFTYKTFSIF